MTVAWVLYALVFGGLLTVAARGAELLLRAANKPVRFVWGAAMALTLLVPVARPWVTNAPREPAHVAAVASLPVPAAAAVPHTLFEQIEVTGTRLLQAVSAAVTTPIRQTLASAARVPHWLDTLVAALLVLLAVGGVVLFGIVYLRFSSRRRHWPHRVLQGAQVRITPDVGPAVMGVAPAEIVVPGWLLTRSASEQQLVLAHEGEHVRARDPWLLLLASGAVALMPWHALLWYMWSRFRLAVELDCDQRVLRRGATKPEYGQLLVELSGHQPCFAPVMPAFSCGTSHLEQRLLAMTAQPERYRFGKRVMGGLVAAVALLAACRSELPTSAQVEQMDVKTASAAIPGITDATVYTVDGAAVTKAEATAIPAERIASIAVVKGTGAGDANPAGARRRGFVASEVAIKLKTDTAGHDPARVMYLGDSVAVKGSGLELTGQNLRLTSSAGRTVVEKSDSVRIPVRGSGSGESVIALRKDPKQEFEGLLVINGTIVDSSELDRLRFHTDDIERVEVIKGPRAIDVYGPRAAKGVVSITLKK